ncbi:MAG: hypothetical protein BroJett012_07850 [Betaproteobacteria bacterium]|jgi:hypothetical protein|nr:MAG: hypothetical protein BroJett012_07850 [Betaproteobacteria bacterium]
MDMTKKLARNERGRDFVVGDIHGAFDLVLRAIDKARFDPARDKPPLFRAGKDSADGVAVPAFVNFNGCPALSK